MNDDLSAEEGEGIPGHQGFEEGKEVGRQKDK